MDDAPDTPEPAGGRSRPKAGRGAAGATKRAGRATAKAPAKAAGRTPVKAAAKPAARQPKAKAVSDTAARSDTQRKASGSPTAGARRRRDAGATARDAPTGDQGRPWRRSRTPGLYDRRIQASHERWPLAARLATRLFSHPDLVLAALGARDPVEVDGRVLNRGTQALLELMKRIPDSVAGRRDDPAAMRANLTRVSRLAMPSRTDVHVTGRVIRTPESPSDIPIRIYRQFGSGLGRDGRQAGRPPAIVCFHGGGWVVGGLDSHDPWCRLLAAASGCIVVSVAYRLAPEHPYPAAVEDALAAYRWVQRHRVEVGHAEGQVGVLGDSAGGNLAAVVAMETRHGVGPDGSDVPAPVAQGLIYPALDARLESASVHSLAEGFLLTAESMEYFRACYLPDREQWELPTVSPLLADDHRGLAPALVVTAGFDPLRDDGALYAETLEKSGVEVEYRCYDDQAHGFASIGILPDSLALATEVCDAMGRLMRRSVSSGPGE